MIARGYGWYGLCYNTSMLTHCENESVNLKEYESGKNYETLPLQEGTRKATGFWSDDYRHMSKYGNARKGKTLRTHRKGR